MYILMHMCKHTCAYAHSHTYAHTFTPSWLSYFHFILYFSYDSTHFPYTVYKHIDIIPFYELQDARLQTPYILVFEIAPW